MATMHFLGAQILRPGWMIPKPGPLSWEASKWGDHCMFLLSEPPLQAVACWPLITCRVPAAHFGSPLPEFCGMLMSTGAKSTFPRIMGPGVGEGKSQQEINHLCWQLV